jgi:hypothetical protein
MFAIGIPLNGYADKEAAKGTNKLVFNTLLLSPAEAFKQDALSYESIKPVGLSVHSSLLQRPYRRLPTCALQDLQKPWYT